MAEQQRTALATRPLIEALADKSRAAFMINSSPVPARSQALLRIWEPAFTNNNPRRKSAPGAFRFMFQKNKPDFSIDDSWLPVRPLGAGSFGAVGLFEHHDEEGKVDDQVVAKYAQVHKEDSIRENIPGISGEAAIMIQLNEIPNSEGVLYLRNFRHYGNMQVWILLLEYCPNLNLEELRLTYKAMKRTLPETFLWYVFYTLAKGLAAMETGLFGEDLDPSKLRPESYLLHRDMKPENTFMGYSASPSDPRLALSSAPTYMGSILSYPHAKIADFGLSTITSNHDPNNTVAKQQQVGSAYWRPPEMRTIHMPPSASTNPFPTTCFDSAGLPLPENLIYSPDQHAYTPAGNTFVVGFMMYQLLTLDEPESMHDYLNRILAQAEDTPTSLLDTSSIPLRTRFFALFATPYALVAQIGQAECGARQAILDMLLVWQDAAYSGELKTLVEQCMAFQPGDRPAAASLLQRIETRMAAHLAAESPRPGFASTSRLFATEAALPSMRPGTAPLARDAQFWRQVLGAYRWLDLERGCIRPDLGESDVPQEAVVFFTPGRREERNRAIGRRDQEERDEAQEIRILNPSKRSRGDSGKTVRVRDGYGETPVVDIRLNDTPTFR